MLKAGGTLVVHLLISLVAPTTATFLQWSLCDNNRTSGLIPYSLLAELAQGLDSPTSQLTLNLTRHQSGVTCSETPGTGTRDDGAWPEAEVQLHWMGFAGPGSFQGKKRARLSCEDYDDNTRPMPLPVNSSRVTMVLLDDVIGELPLLSTLALQVNIDTPIFPAAQCIASLLTPAIPPGLSSGLRYGPLACFLFILAVSVARTFITATRLDPTQGVSEDDSAEDPALAILPSIYDCVHFLQFVFLTGGLSLSFPGFYPASVGHLNWFALFADVALPIKSFLPAFSSELTMMSTAYAGVNDGLYEVNGTYGGYPGLEVMAQTIGSAMTFDAWLLMVLLTGCIATALGLLLWLLDTVRPRNILGLPMLAPGIDSSALARAIRVGSSVLRLVVSYVTMPLIALSSYQFYHFGVLSAGHFAFAVIVLLSILIAFAWLLIRYSPASLGALVLEGGYKYHRIRGEDIEHEEWRKKDQAFVMVVLVLGLIRGLTFGGLQSWGVVQLAMLVACELVTILAFRLFRPYPLRSTGFAMIPLRMALLLCLVPCTFSPSRLLTLKTMSLYLSLCLSAAGLLAAFFVPSCWHAYRILLWGHSRFVGNSIGQGAPVFNLRQLQRRERDVSRQSSSQNLVPGPLQTAYDHHSRFYRPSRSPVPLTPGEPSRYSHLQPLQSERTSSGTYLDSSPIERPRLSRERSPDYFTANPSTSLEHQASPAMTEGFSPATAGSNSTDRAHGLGPRWHDYSFREADLVFTAPPPVNAILPAMRRQPAVPSAKPSRWPWPLRFLDGGVEFIWKPARPTESGFSVVRPNQMPLAETSATNSMRNIRS